MKKFRAIPGKGIVANTNSSKKYVRCSYRRATDPIYSGYKLAVAKADEVADQLDAYDFKYKWVEPLDEEDDWYSVGVLFEPDTDYEKAVKRIKSALKPSDIEIEESWEDDEDIDDDWEDEENWATEDQGGFRGMKVIFIWNM